MAALNSEQLLVGSLHALRHAAALIEDSALLLCAKGRSSTCFMLAIFAREELGRHVLLAREAKALAPGATVEAGRVRDKLKDHVIKLRFGQSVVSVPLTAAQSATLNQPLSQATAASDAALRRLYAEVHKLARMRRRRLPDDLNNQRRQAQYVDVTDRGEWSTPDSLTPLGEARALLVTVVAECSDAILALHDAAWAPALHTFQQTHEMPCPFGFASRVLLLLTRAVPQ